MNRLCIALALLAGCTSAPSGDAPLIPVGLDAFRRWDLWPAQRIGARTYMRSTYDRRGGNESADASHFLYQESKTRSVPLDVSGPGILVFARYNHWHGSPWHYEVDGTNHIVQESSSADPTRPVDHSVFLPGNAFPAPLAQTWSVTQGADLSWVPVAFEKSFRMAYTRTRYGTGYYIYQQFVEGAKLSRPLRAWSPAETPDPAVLELLSRPADRLDPPGDVHRAAGRRLDLAGPASIRLLTLSAPRERALELGRARLRITWDGRDEASVDAPLALFFGAGNLHNRDGREYLVKAFPMSIRFDAGRVHLTCAYPMPYFRSARIEVGGEVPVELAARTTPFDGPPNHAAYFHATYRDLPEPVPGRDLVLLDTKGAEQSADWSGSFVGMSWIFSHRADLTTLEGDPRFYFDDSRSPQAYGTGTEEWGGGGDYWGGRNMSLPFAGHPSGVRNEKDAARPEDLVQSAYRFLLSDLMPFGRRAVIRLEHGGRNESTEHYESVVYWYGLPGASLVPVDEIDVGDEASERAHGYVATEVSPPLAIESRFEEGPDTLNGREIFPTHTETGRSVRGRSEFTLKMDPANHGVLLRRTLDYSHPNQRAGVWIAEPGTEDFKPAGVWYLAGANTCVYSDPKGELGETQHKLQTSNRRFRDDEFLLPVALTRGRTALRVRLVFSPVDRELFPGTPFPGEQAWSELHYRAYAWRLPPAPPLK